MPVHSSMCRMFCTSSPAVQSLSGSLPIMVVTQVIESVEGCLLGIDEVTGKMTPIEELEDLTPIDFEAPDAPIVDRNGLCQCQTPGSAKRSAWLVNDHNHKILAANRILENKRDNNKRRVGLDAAFEQAVTHCVAAAGLLFQEGWFRGTLRKYNAVNVTLQPHGFNVSMDYCARTSRTAESLPTAESFPTAFSYRKSGGAWVEDVLPTTLLTMGTEAGRDEIDFSNALMFGIMEDPHQTNNNNKKIRPVGQLTFGKRTVTRRCVRRRRWKSDASGPIQFSSVHFSSTWPSE